MEIQLGSYTPVVKFIVREKLKVPIILGGDFCDRFLEIVSPRRKCVTLDDENRIPIVQSASKTVIETQTPRVQENRKATESIQLPNVRLAIGTRLSAGTQVWGE